MKSFIPVFLCELLFKILLCVALSFFPGWIAAVVVVLIIIVLAPVITCIVYCVCQDGRSFSPENIEAESNEEVTRFTPCHNIEEVRYILCEHT